MKKEFLKTLLTPVIAIMLCILLYLSGYFQMVFAALIVLIASWVEYRKGTFKSLGFQRSHLKLIPLLVIAPTLAAVIFALYWFVLIPVVTNLTGQPMDFSLFETYKGDLKAVMILFPFIWVSAAFGEEIVFRGYLMRQFTKFFGNGKVSLILNITLLGVLFGWIHLYQGISGQIVTGIIGMIFATIFHFRKNDLWFNIALHGFVDTIALVLIYIG